MSSRKRYAQVGLGVRSAMYTEAMAGDFKKYCDLVAICDRNQGRMDLCNRRNKEKLGAPVKTYHADQFDRMIAEQKPDVIIVTTGPDVTHADYICRAMELGCDVVTEKPMATDEVSCQKIIQAQRKTGKNIQVTFNYRYSPARSQIKQLLMDGAIGEILSVNLTWMLDTHHGADYFRRWHRKLKNSGSLLVHKATHHFDLVNWWLEDHPQDVFCRGSLKYYTPQNADRMGLRGRADRCLNCPVKDKCKFYFNITAGELKELYLDCEKEDGYIRDKCVFADEIDIWDNMAVTVRYECGTLFNYMLHAYSAYEGYRIAINGTKGRIEQLCCENTYLSGDGTAPGELTRDNVSITLIPEFSKPQDIHVDLGQGGHGGGDPIMLADIFDPDAPADPLKRKATHIEGAYSVLTGIAAYKSIATDRAVRLKDLLGDVPFRAVP